MDALANQVVEEDLHFYNVKLFALIERIKK